MKVSTSTWLSLHTGNGFIIFMFFVFLLLLTQLIDTFFAGAKIALGEELPLQVMAYPVDSADGAQEGHSAGSALMNGTFQKINLWHLFVCIVQE